MHRKINNYHSRKRPHLADCGAHCSVGLPPKAGVRTSAITLKRIWQRRPILKRHQFLPRYLHQFLYLQERQIITKQSNLQRMVGIASEYLSEQCPLCVS